MATDAAMTFRDALGDIAARTEVVLTGLLTPAPRGIRVSASCSTVRSSPVGSRTIRSSPSGRLPPEYRMLIDARRSDSAAAESPNSFRRASSNSMYTRSLCTPASSTCETWGSLTRTSSTRSAYRSISA